MIEIILSLDYEIYGNGCGSLRELVYEPTERLAEVADKYRVPFVIFTEAAELEIIEAHGKDPAVGLIKNQLRVLRARGFEIGLHLHPQWYNARFEKNMWMLDQREYNLCTLAPDRIDHIIARSIAYLRTALEDPEFAPLSFRAGNWLLQPTRDVARSLVKNGIKIDSSVFKGGLQHQHGLDYRKARKNGYYWRFSEDVNRLDSEGQLIELPTFSEMVPFWRLFTAKRIGLQQKAPATSRGPRGMLNRLRDFIRFRQPMKLDFCRLVAKEMIEMLDREMDKDRSAPSVYRPIIAIGHTKDLRELETIDDFLAYLRMHGISISIFKDVYPKLLNWNEEC